MRDCALAATVVAVAICVLSGVLFALAAIYFEMSTVTMIILGFWFYPLVGMIALAAASSLYKR